jgi:aminopeptidase N
MKFKKIIFLFIHLTVASVFAQQSTDYKGEREKLHVLEHTKLKVDFNFKDKQLNGEAWITVKPYFYPTDKLILDAKGMIIHQVALKGEKLDFNYDNFKLRIDLPKKHTKEESYTLYIKYTARPEKVKQKGKKLNHRLVFHFLHFFAN